MRTSRSLAVVVMLVTAMLAAGCASGSDDAAATSATDGSSSSTGAADVIDNDDTGEAGAADQSAAAAAGGEDADGAADAAEPEAAPDGETRNDQFVSPVFEALGFDPNDRLAARNEYVADAEELVRACMADAGFEYVPDVPGFAPSFERQLELSSTISADRFTAEYGYGIATLLELDFREDGVLAFVELLLGPAPEEARSDGEQAAYELALSGTTIQGLNAEDAQEQAFENAFGSEGGSCRSEGYDAADNTVGEKFDGLFTLLGDEYEAIDESVENDPRIREVLADWQTCMAGYGYSYENPNDIQDELFDATNGLRQKFQTSPEALTLFGAAGDANLSGMNADDRFDWLESNGAFQGFSMVPALQAELDGLIDFELTVADHDVDCAEPDLYIEVRSEYEVAFVEEHAEQLQLIAAGEA